MEIPHVIGSTRMTPKELVSQTTDLVSLPDIYVRIKSIIYDPSSTLKDVADALSYDPAICARLLKVANSAFFGTPSKVETIKAAVRLLGTEQVHDLVLAATITKAFTGIPDNLIDMEEFWVESVRCGLIGKLLAKSCNSNDKERFFVGNLLHDMGHLVMYQIVPDECREALITARQTGEPLYLVEREIIGCDYGQVGSLLMHSWNFPEAWVQAVRYHNEPGDAADHCLDTAIMHISARTKEIDIASHDHDMDAAIPASIDPVVWSITGLEEDMLVPLLIEADEQLNTTLETIFPEYRLYPQEVE